MIMLARLRDGDAIESDVNSMNREWINYWSRSWGP